MCGLPAEPLRPTPERVLAMALCDCLDRLLSSRATVEECLAFYPHLRPDLSALLQTARELLESRSRVDERLIAWSQLRTQAPFFRLERAIRRDPDPSGSGGRVCDK